MNGNARRLFLYLEEEMEEVSFQISFYTQYTHTHKPCDTYLTPIRTLSQSIKRLEKLWNLPSFIIFQGFWHSLAVSRHESGGWRSFLSYLAIINLFCLSFYVVCIFIYVFMIFLKVLSSRSECSSTA